jgi:hypothetical protein
MLEKRRLKSLDDEGNSSEKPLGLSSLSGQAFYVGFPYGLKTRGFNDVIGR